MNWYTRRVVLAGIYKTTELYMLQDNSEDHQKTWNFLERRIKDATQIHTILTTTSDMALPDLNRASEAASAAFVTVSILKYESSFSTYLHCIFLFSTGTQYTWTELE